MIPANITSEHIEKAIEEINIQGVPRGRESSKYDLQYNGEFYPPKYVLSIANKFANGHELDAAAFSGGDESNTYLKNLGFEIIEKDNDKLINGNNTWIFQGNPISFDVDLYLEENKHIWWSLNQKHFENRINIGDIVYIWRSDGNDKDSGGIVAKAIIEGYPENRQGPVKYYKNDRWKETKLRYPLEVLEYRKVMGMVKRVYLISEPSLKNLRILNMRSETNYLLNTNEANEINELWKLNMIYFEEEEELFPEGRRLYRQHRVIERNPRLIREAKKRYKAKKGKLECEICGFSFETKYGKLGEDYIEGHHTKSISGTKGEYNAKVEDIALVCSNCHRMLHLKRPWPSIDELKKLLIND